MMSLKHATNQSTNSLVVHTLIITALIAQSFISSTLCQPKIINPKVTCGQYTDRYEGPNVSGSDPSISPNLGPSNIPWLAVIIGRDSITSKIRCAGVIIHERFVLTAANCVKELFTSYHSQQAANLSVRVGDFNVLIYENHEQVYSVKEIHLFDGTLCPKSKTNCPGSVALLENHKPFEWRPNVDELGLVLPICLPNRGVVYNSNYPTFYGWGQPNLRDLDSGEPWATLRKYRPIEYCKRMMAHDKNGSSLSEWNSYCVGPVHSKDIGACGWGDLGGPLIYTPSEVSDHAEQQQQQQQQQQQSTLLGVWTGNPWNKNCLKRNRIELFARVEYYLDWIERKLRGNNRHLSSSQLPNGTVHS